MPLTQPPAAAGVREQIIVSGLAAETTYYFALRASDEAGNRSPMSNVAEGTTVVCHATAGRFALEATGPGGTSTAGPIVVSAG